MGGTEHGFVESRGVFTTVDAPGMDFTQLNGINDVGQIVGLTGSGSLTGPPLFRGFVDINDTFTILEIPDINDDNTLGINNSGQVVGSFSGDGGRFGHGFLATPTPEPASLPLLVFGLAVVGIVIRLGRFTAASGGH
jgi:hypothetical protein